MNNINVFVVVNGKVVCTMQSTAPFYPPVGSTLVLHDNKMPEEYQSIPLKVLHHTTEVSITGIVIMVAAELI